MFIFTDFGSLSQLGNALIAVIIFTALMYVFYFLAKRLGPGGGIKRYGNIKIVEAVAVGQGVAVQLIEVAGEYYLVGVSKTQVTLITKLDGESAERVRECLSGGGGLSVVPFEKHLQRLFNSAKGKKTEDGEQSGERTGEGDK